MMDDFLNKADKVSFKKQELMDNLGQLKEAIKMFERLIELQKSVGDPNSPRAIQYYKLAQQIASINEGWRNAQAQLSREATLADRDPDHPDRLSEAEREKLKSLMLSSKLKNFVEYLDADNPDNFSLLKYIVQYQTVTVNRKAPSMEDIINKEPSFNPIKFKEEIHKSMDGLMKEYTAASETKAQLRDNDLRVFISGLFLNYFEALNESLESIRESSEEDKDLIKQEKERQESSTEQEAYAEVMKTSKEVSAYIKDSASEPKKTTRYKITEEKGKNKRGTSWWDDFKEVLKWGMLLAGGMAAVAGIASVLGKSFESFKERGKESLKEIEEALKSYMDRKAEGLEASIARLDKDSIPDAAADMKARIEALQNNPNLKGMAPKFDEDTMTLMGAIRATGNTKLADHFIKLFMGDNTKAEVAVARALLEGKDIAEWRDRGEAFSVPLSPRIKTDDLTEEQLAQRYVDTVDEARQNVINASTMRGLGMFMSPSESDAYYQDIVNSGGGTLDLLGGRIGQGLNATFRGIRAGRTMNLPDNWDSMTPSEKENYLLSTKRFIRAMDDKLYQRGSLLWDPANVEGVPAAYLSDLQVGEIITNPLATKSRDMYPGFAEAIQSGDLKSVMRAMNRSYFGGKSWSMDNPEDVYRAKIIMNTKDWGSSDTEYYKSVNEGMRYFGREEVQPPVQQTIINNYTTENSQDAKPGSL